MIDHVARTWEHKRGKRQTNSRNDQFARSDAVAARRVLRDCHFAFRELQSAEPGTVWRLRWVTIITLLRAVGHVLDKIDGKRSPYLGGAIKEIWTDIKTKKSKDYLFF